MESNSIIATFAHGNGPYSRTIDLGLSINEQLKARKLGQMPIIVPLVYGDRQKRIMLEDFGDMIKEDSDKILLDKFYGQILNELFFKTGHYQENLEFLLEKQPELEARLRNYLSGTLRTERFDGTEVLIKSKEGDFEISHNPRVATGYKNSFYTTIGFFSEILHKASLEENLISSFDPKILKEVEEKIANKIEEDKSIHFMPEPFVFSHEETRERWKDEIFTPPFIHVLKENNEQLQKGMYVMVTGIDGLRNLFDGVHSFNMRLYFPPFIKNIPEGSDNAHGPAIIANPNIAYQFGRTGWSTVWWSHMTETPLIAPAYVRGDDPEIYFNEKSAKKLGLAVIFDGNRNPKETLAEADHLRPILADVNRKLIDNYGTLDGMDYTAKIVIDVLEGKDISSYKKIEPILNTPKVSGMQ